MTDIGASPPMREAGCQPGDKAVTRLLRRLTAAYPAFRFSRESGQKGARWVAERRDQTASGVPVVITASLMELHTALRTDRDRDGQVRHKMRRLPARRAHHRLRRG